MKRDNPDDVTESTQIIDNLYVARHPGSYVFSNFFLQKLARKQAIQDPGEKIKTILPHRMIF